ncbi:uncharacterized protein LOC135115794 [Scylla paramamosain]|uniref:uncharacterized protein LOC135115794 n=1 Tax=Scylla paramamosain TaxID=85552 RepID=UPI003083A588
MPSTPIKLKPTLSLLLVATSSKDKAQLLATLFAGKMEVDDPERSPPLLEQQCRETVTKEEMMQGLVERLLQGLDVQKATGPDNISPHVLKQCARELAVPLTTVFSACLWENTWPLVWKEVRVVPVQKRSSRSDPKNYRPISLLSVVGKVFERMVADVVCRHLQDNYLLSDQQFGFSPGRSTFDLLMLLTGDWQDALDGGLDSVVVALDIAGAFDRVWHGGLLEKLRAKGIQGDLLQLLGDYLQGRTLQVVVNGVRAAEEINQQLGVIQEWGARWQVTFAPEKTQVMVVSRSPAAELAVEGGLSFGGLPLKLHESVKILGVEVDRGLRKLDGIQRRALRLVEAAGAPAHPEAPVNTLEHRKDVAALVVFQKAQVQGVPHLAGLRLSTRLWMDTFVSTQCKDNLQFLLKASASWDPDWHDYLLTVLIVRVTLVFVGVGEDCTYGSPGSGSMERAFQTHTLYHLHG